MKILITGASGFIGGALAARLAADGHALVAAARSARPDLQAIARIAMIKDINADTYWREALSGAEAVVHAAAHVHIARPTYEDMERFQSVNVDGTANLARQAAAAGVKRFVFISSVAVNGVCNRGADNAFTAEDMPHPATPYGHSKHEAEKALESIARETGMEVVIIRPPLVYGKGSRGNLAALEKLIGLGIPLPFGSLDDRRSLVSIGNLVDFTALCLSHEKAANQTFLVADAEAVSITELVRAQARSMGKKVVLLKFPKTLLKHALRVLRRKELADRIFEPLVVDISKNQRLLGWVPSKSSFKTGSPGG